MINAGERILELLHEKNMSQYMLAKKTGIPCSSINTLIRKNHSPTLSYLERICEGLGVTIGYFMKENCEDADFHKCTNGAGTCGSIKHTGSNKHRRGINSHGNKNGTVNCRKKAVRYDNGPSDDLKMSKSRNRKIFITEEAVKKVPKINYKGIPRTECDIILEFARNTLKIAKEKNNSDEVAITYNMDSKNQDIKERIGVALGAEHNVDLAADTDSYHILCNSRKNTVVVLHNHPSLSNISLTDIKFFINYESVKMMVVVTNYGGIFYVVKTEKYDKGKSVKLLNEAISLHNKAKNVKEMRKANDYFIKKCYNAGIVYDYK